jgi:hypothetical protein
MEVVGFGPSSTILRRNSVMLGQFLVTELVSTFTPFIWHNVFFGARVDAWGIVKHIVQLYHETLYKALTFPLESFFLM